MLLALGVPPLASRHRYVHTRASPAPGPIVGEQVTARSCGRELGSATTGESRCNAAATTTARLDTLEASAHRKGHDRLLRVEPVLRLIINPRQLVIAYLGVSLVSPINGHAV